MTRFSALSAIFLTGAFITLLATINTPPEAKSGRLDETNLHDGTRQRVASYQCFKQTLNRAIDDLTKGKTSLADATARIYDAALRFNPGYLDRIAVGEKGATPQERIARNLIGHVASLREVNPAMQTRVDALQRELAELVGTSH